MINPRLLKSLHENKEKVTPSNIVKPLTRKELRLLDSSRVKHEDKLDLIDRYVKLEDLKKQLLKKK